MAQAATSLEELLDQIDEARDGEASVSLDQILDAVGRRSFGPLLVVAGLIVLAPVIGDIPGMSTIMGVFVAMVAVQIVLGRDHVWLPQWMLQRSVQSSRLAKPIGWLRKPARWIDGLTRPRLQALVGGMASRVVAGICLGVAAVMPLMEVVPFSANAAGLVLVVFGLALIASDGLMALIGAIVSVGTLVLIGRVLL